MSRAAKFTARGLIFASAGKLKFSRGHRSRQSLHHIVSAREREGMHRIGARNPEMNRNPGGNQNAMWNEQVLLRNHAHGHRAVGVLLGSEIVFDKLPGEVKR